MAALQVLRGLGLEEQTREAWVQGENIAQTFQFVSSGNAQLGFVALSQVLEHDTGALREGSAWRVPRDLHEPIRQDVVLLEQAADSVVARALLDFMRGAQARGIIRSYGYDVAYDTGENG